MSYLKLPVKLPQNRLIAMSVKRVLLRQSAKPSSAGLFENSSVFACVTGFIPFGDGEYDNYLPLIGAHTLCNAGLIANNQQVMRRNGTFRNLHVVINVTPILVGTRTFTLNVNGVDTALTCTITAGNLTCNDTVNEVAVNAGDLVCIHHVSIVGALNCVGTVGVELAGGTNNFATILYSHCDGIYGTSGYHAPIDSFAGQLVEARAQQIIPRAGTLKNLRVNLSVAPGGATSWVTTVHVNGVPTALTCTIAGAATTCTDIVNEVAVNAGDLVCTHMLAVAGPAATLGRITMEWHDGGVNTCFFMYVNHAIDTSEVANNYAPVDSGWGVEPAATEVEMQQVVAVSGTLRNLYASVGVAPGVGTSWVITVRVNGVNTGLTCTIAGAATANNDTVNTVAVNAGDLLSVEWAPVNGPADPDIIRQSMELVI